jgi:DNA-binding MarR family transcriptional regulator
VPLNVVQHESYHLYASLPESPSGRRALAAILRFREVESLRGRQATEELGLHGVDLLAVRYLLQAKRDGRSLRQSDLALMLDLSSAGVTKLVDRLTEAGWLAREAHPTDRRARLITATTEAEERTAAAYTPVHQPLVDSIDSLESEQADVLITVVQRLIAAMEQA